MEMPDIQNAQRRAEEIIEKYNPEGLSPFPFEKIEEDRRDLSIVLISLSSNLSGVIEFNKDKNEFTIFVNIDKSKTRQYFTIAHELGHYFLHQDTIRKEEIIIDSENSSGNRELFRLDVYKYTKIETEANNFAASLIMPTDLVKKAWKIFENVEECAKVFNVSVSAMSVRLEKLNLI